MCMCMYQVRAAAVIHALCCFPVMIAHNALSCLPLSCFCFVLCLVKIAHSAILSSFISIESNDAGRFRGGQFRQRQTLGFKEVRKQRFKLVRLRLDVKRVAMDCIITGSRETVSNGFLSSKLALQAVENRFKTANYCAIQSMVYMLGSYSHSARVRDVLYVLMHWSIKLRNICVCTHTHTYIYMHTHTQTHTHTHTYVYICTHIFPQYKAVQHNF